jgi:hypothetical protein
MWLKCLLTILLIAGASSLALAQAEPKPEEKKPEASKQEEPKKDEPKQEEASKPEPDKSASEKPAAEESAKGKRAKGKPAATNFISQLEAKIAAAELSDEQKAKFKAISEEFAPKLAELNKKFEEGMPQSLRKQLSSSRKELMAAGTKRKDITSELASKVQLTDEQKQLMEETNRAKEKLQHEFTAKVGELLTTEQVAKAGIKIPKRKKASQKNEQ